MWNNSITIKIWYWYPPGTGLQKLFEISTRNGMDLWSVVCQSSFLAHEQRSYESRVGVPDRIHGREVKVWDTGGIGGRGAFHHLPDIGEALPWSNLGVIPYSVPKRMTTVSKWNKNGIVRITKVNDMRLHRWIYLQRGTFETVVSHKLQRMVFIGKPTVFIEEAMRLNAVA